MESFVRERAGPSSSEASVQEVSATRRITRFQFPSSQALFRVTLLLNLILTTAILCIFAYNKLIHTASILRPSSPHLNPRLPLSTFTPQNTIELELYSLLQNARNELQTSREFPSIPSSDLIKSFLPVYSNSLWISTFNAPPKPSEIPLIIVIGFGKTGTTSISAALNILGVRSIHYNVIQDRLFPSDMNLRDAWDKKGYKGKEEIYKTSPSAGRLGSEQFNFELFNDVDAITDSPVPQFYLELIHTYPKSRVILSMRVLEKWINSQQKHFGVDYEWCFNDLSQWVKKWCQKTMTIRKRLMMDSSNDLNAIDESIAKGLLTPENCGFIAQRHFMYGSMCVSKDQALKRYLIHNANVLRQIPSDRLLIMDPTDNDQWDVLCTFLNRSIPQNKPFPIANVHIAK
mmetsp:Transcript_6312/g.11254  ORF Transcript_6312/g.11254 Transcript_6312/m.11254 type:complete len:402 (-) Transcript_6312:88-1293(-)